MSEPVARYIISVLEERDDVSTELVDVRDHLQTAITIPPWGEGGADEVGSAWKNIVEKSAALILIIPEYNHGYPGELKLLLDSLWSEYKGKPVAMVGVSKGTLGGARVLDHIKPVLVEMHLQPIRESVSFSKVGEAFNEDGSIKNEKTTEYVQKVVTDLVATAAALAPLRK
jgi:NAD(P)H-dependent FMN reductase